jgi:2-polyprenyl-3-methyl-5-hydroxy-6-metoxy-1,4-benzoquinol methylase
MLTTKMRQPLQEMVSLYQHFDEFKEALLYLHQYQGRMEGLNVLEAGCGAKSNLNLINCVLTGIDISQNQLNRNSSLQFKVCADLQTYANEAWSRSFDLIVCWDVLEHPESLPVVFKKFSSWIKNDSSRLILVFPNAQTLKGYVTKYSPSFLHRLFIDLL